MAGLLDWAKRAAPRRRMVEVGWIIDIDSAGFIYDAPHPYQRQAPAQASNKAVGYCPAILDYEARLFEVLCPFDLHLRLGKNEQGAFKLNYPDQFNSASNPKFTSKLVEPTHPNEWRDPAIPVLQIRTPYRFVTDETVFINMMPAFHHFRQPPLPGLVIGGRFPLRDWPRALNWAFEWHDKTQDLVLKRGEPWFTLRFETEDPSRQVRLVEAEMTPELRRFARGMDGVTSFVDQTFSLFGVARSRRPKRLLVKAKR